jgi:hypothetical protein
MAAQIAVAALVYGTISKRVGELTFESGFFKRHDHPF